MQNDLDFEDKKEIAIRAYKKSYDLDIALITANMTSAEKEALKRDESFLSQIVYVDSLLKEELIDTMLNNMREGKPELSQKAAMDLGKLVWPDKFNGKAEAPKGNIPDTIILVGKK